MPTVTEIMYKVYEHFAKNKRHEILTFVKYNSQEEWWFDAEIAVFLDGQGVKFEREKYYFSEWNAKTEKMVERYSDFYLHLNDGEHIMETKAFLNNPDKSRLKEVYDTLTACKQDKKWLLTIAYPYSKEQWQDWFKLNSKTFPNAEPSILADFPLSESQKCTFILWKIL